MDAGDLLPRWVRDAAVAAPEAGPRRWWDEGEALLDRWSEPHRRYHTLEHLREVLDVLDQLESQAEVAPREAAVARVAAWYHDVAYDPRAQPGSNEHRSATIARDHLHRLGAGNNLVDLVEAVVLASADHRRLVTGSPGGAGPPGVRADRVRVAFHDADLWILAAPPQRFDSYCGQVREEYAHVDDEAYARARGRVLQALVGRPEVYLTTVGRSRWQEQARANVRRELDRLLAAR